jgi:predicted AlkP superfamily pyrophosphatase or phosphodiesterase
MKNILKIFVLVLILFGNSLAQKDSYVILVSFDGFRWDYLNRGLTPNLDKVIDNGVRALSLRPCFPSKRSLITFQLQRNVSTKSRNNFK